MSTPNDSQHLCVNICKALEYHQDGLKSNTTLKEFVFTLKCNTVEEVMRFNKILDHMQNQDYQDQI